MITLREDFLYKIDGLIWIDMDMSKKVQNFERPAWIDSEEPDATLLLGPRGPKRQKQHVATISCMLYEFYALLKTLTIIMHFMAVPAFLHSFEKFYQKEAPLV